MRKVSTVAFACLFLTLIVVPVRPSVAACTAVSDPGAEPAKVPGQQYLYIHVSGLVQLLTWDKTPGKAWLLLPDARYPVDYVLATQQSLFSESHYGRVLLLKGTDTDSQLVPIARCASPVDSSGSLQGRSLGGWIAQVETGAPSTLTLDPSLSSLPDIDRLVEKIKAFDPTSMLTPTPASLSSSTTSDLLSRVDLTGGTYYVSKRWKCDGTEDFNFVRWGSVGGSPVNGQVVAGTTGHLAAVLTARFPISGSVHLKLSTFDGSPGPDIELAPDGDVIELIVENVPPSGNCNAYGLHFAGHYFLSGKLDKTGHVLVPVPEPGIREWAIDAMCSPSSSDGNP